MATLELDAETERLLEKAAREAGLTPAATAREAIIRFLEDLEDTRIADERLANPGRRIPLAEVKKNLGLGD